MQQKRFSLAAAVALAGIVVIGCVATMTSQTRQMAEGGKPVVQAAPPERVVYQPRLYVEKKTTTTTPDPNDKYASYVVKLYTDGNGQWRWSLETTNGHTMAMSHQYKTRAAAMDGLQSVEAVFVNGCWRYVEMP